MAVKIIRQPKKIALLGSATSAAALRAGHERAPAALRAAGLADGLKSAGFEVADLGDTATYSFQPDDEYPRAQKRFRSPKIPQRFAPARGSRREIRRASADPQRRLHFRFGRRSPARAATIAMSA